MDKCIKVQIIYSDYFCKVKIFSIEDDYILFMKWYGFDPEKCTRTAKQANGTELEYFVPKTTMFGKEQDDNFLCVKYFVVNKNYDWPGIDNKENIQ